MRPDKNDYFPYLEAYISKVKEQDAISALENGLSNSLIVIEGIPPDKWNFSYESNKWSIKELMVHIIDVERVFAYRALAFARGEAQVLPAFDENVYALNSEANSRTPEAIINEFKNVRASNIGLFKGFSNSALQKTGKLPAGHISVNALAFAICGHTAHHVEVLLQRYLK